MQQTARNVVRLESTMTTSPVYVGTVVMDSISLTRVASLVCSVDSGRLPGQQKLYLARNAETNVDLASSWLWKANASLVLEEVIELKEFKPLARLVPWAGRRLTWDQRR